jgi:phage terminase large subunit-like protein
MTKHANVRRGHKYALDVVSGKQIACKWIVLACQRYLEDLDVSKKDKKSKYYFDKDAAERVLVLKQMMPHTKGKWAQRGEKIRLEPWQCFFNMNLFGWKSRETQLRRYRRALLLVPRKNGKSAEAATTGIYMLAFDNEFGAEVYSGATSEKQAWEVFRPAKQMISKTPELIEAKGIEVNASNINIQETGSRFEPIIGNPGDGQSPSCAIIDEYHEHPDDRVYDTMITGMGAREQPILLAITTAGGNLAGPCYQMQLEAQKILEGSLTDDTLFAMIFTIDEGDDWASVVALKKANPNFGVSVMEEFLLNQLNAAKNNARKQTQYKTKHLNVWVGSREAYFNIERWNSSADSTLKIQDYYGRRAYIGMDLASKVDIAALQILIPLGDDAFVTFGRYYLPESALESTASEHYMGWTKDGFLNVTDGEIIDFKVIKAEILDLCRHFEVSKLAYDAHQATMLVTDLMEHGVPCVDIPMRAQHLSEPMKQIDGLVRSRQIAHNGDPCMTWMMSNVTAKIDANDNVFPRKERDENKIDAPVALIMAMNRYMNDDYGSLDNFLNDPISVEF